jgi:ABC-type sugar transport system ATPase subunit
VRNPAAFLFDEPLSNLDAKLRGQMRVELRRLHRELGATMIYVTHDQIEAMTLGDRVAVMNSGQILQIGSPLSLYQRPVNLFVARFIGSVPINLSTGAVVDRDGKRRFESSGVNFGIDPTAIETVGLTPTVTIGFRSEDVEVNRESDSESHFSGRVVAIDRLGDSANLHVAVDGKQTVKERAELDSGSGDTFVVRTSADTAIADGDRIQLKIRSDRILWFDAESGKNLLKDWS